MDNLGYGEVGCYGGGLTRGAATPRIDKLAREGMKLLNFNVEPQCTPSRSAILTGRFALRSGTHSVPLTGEPYGLVQWEITLAKLLAGQGYATGHFGKDRNRRRADFHLFWPDKPYTEERTVLVAGCGTSQAAKHAARWPAARVIGIDFSATSVQHTEDLQRKYGLAQSRGPSAFD